MIKEPDYVRLFFLAFCSIFIELSTMEKEIISKIQNSGYKKKYLAERLKVSENYLSMCLKGKRNLSEEKKLELTKIIG